MMLRTNTMISKNICNLVAVAATKRATTSLSKNATMYRIGSCNFLHTHSAGVNCGKCAVCTCASNKKFMSTVPYQKGSTEAGLKYEMEDVAANHLGRQQNHIWSLEEIDYHLNNQPHHKPKNITDRLARGLMDVLYHGFNFVTGYKAMNSSVKSIEWRLIVLESVAGVPGFVAAGFRHFRSLRSLRRDHGWIATLLEEAENERMHLLICMKMFKASFITRTVVMGAQFVLTPFLVSVYLIHPPAAHRFVGYLEETACATYTNVIRQIESPGTPLHAAWSTLPAPAVGKAYYRLPDDAMFVDTLKCMFADEAHHRDVNHTFAELHVDEPSPFALSHKKDALLAYEMEKSGQKAWPSAAEIKERAAARDRKPTLEEIDQAVKGAS